MSIAARRLHPFAAKTSMSESTISTEASHVTLINVFTVAAENQDRLVRMLVETTEKTMSKVPGFVSANIHKSLDGVRVANYAQWRSKEDFEAMLKNPEAGKHMAPIQAIATNDVHLYQVVGVHSA
jgi:heme-degrading monooxygenase HmoA